MGILIGPDRHLDAYDFIYDVRLKQVDGNRRRRGARLGDAVTVEEARDLAPQPELGDGDPLRSWHSLVQATTHTAQLRAWLTILLETLPKRNSSLRGLRKHSKEIPLMVAVNCS